MTTIDPQWVDDDEQLAMLCASWRQKSTIAIDTEFMRSDTFFPHIGLLQIADSKSVYLIDPLKINDKSSLIELLLQPSVVKVIHSCSQDLAVFHHYLGILPEPVFDTQIAAAFTGHGMAISYANLLNTLLGIDIPKQETRSNWLQRPLSPSQLHYAALDVYYLLPIHRQLQQQLERQQRLAWLASDCQQLLDSTRQSLEQTDHLIRVKSAWRLDRQSLAVLTTLCHWREQQAREQDVPRNRIIKDDLIRELAVIKPQSRDQLQHLKTSHLQTIIRYGDTLLTLIDNVIADDDDNYPALLPQPLSREQNRLVKRLKAEVRAIAQANGLPAELLARNKDYEMLVRSEQGSGGYQLPPSLKNWRQSLLEGPLMTLLAEECSSSLEEK